MGCSPAFVFPMRKCAFLTLADPTGYVIDDELAYAPLVRLDWKADAIPWQRPDVNWNAYDAVVIRSTWDYPQHLDLFLDVLARIERSGTPLLNGLNLVRWNIRKTYLRDLAAHGVPVVPTIWRDRLNPGELPALFDAVGTEEIVIKPVVGANAAGAFHLQRKDDGDADGLLSRYYANRALMAQPFLSNVTTEGEFSLFYFNGQLSHTIVKIPKAKDFRVQEEHGGSIRPAKADEVLRAAGELTLTAIGEIPLYVRADFVRGNSDDRYLLVELELIEPSLYLRMDSSAPERFAQALHDRIVG